VECKLCGKECPPDMGRILVKGYGALRYDTILSPEKMAAIDLLPRLGLDPQFDVFMCNECIDTKFMPSASEFLREKEERLRKHLQDASSNRPYLGSDRSRDIEVIGGVGRLGVSSALPLLLEIYDIAKQGGFHAGGIAYWVLQLLEKFLSDGTLRPEDLTTQTKSTLAACLEQKMEEERRSAYSWASRLHYVEELLKRGIHLSEPVPSTVESWSSAAEEYLATGESSDASWGATPEIGRAYAKEVLDTAKRIRELLR